MGPRPHLTYMGLEGSLGQKKIVGSLHSLGLGFHTCQIGGWCQRICIHILGLT